MTETNPAVERGEIVEADAASVAKAQGEEDDVEEENGEAIMQPAKLLRIASMLRNMQVSCQEISLDDAGRRQLAEIQHRAVAALEDVLSEELHDELMSVFPDLPQEPSEGEVRLAQAQLVGWLEGLFQGIQASIAAQQMSAQQQLLQMRQAKQRADGPGEGEGEGRQLPGYGTYL